MLLSCVLSVFQYEFISKEILNTNILYSVVIFPWLHVISHNKLYLQERITEESNPFIRGIIQKDVEFLDSIQVEMATARQFVLIARLKNLRPEQVFTAVNRIEKVISEQGFEFKRFKKEDIKRFLCTSNHLLTVSSCLMLMVHCTSILITRKKSRRYDTILFFASVVSRTYQSVIKQICSRITSQADILY